MMPAAPPAGGYDLTPVKRQIEHLEQLVDVLTKQRAAEHQWGDAESKLLELDQAAATDNRRKDLLFQQADASKRRAAAKILLLTLTIGQHNAELSMLRAVMEQAGRMVQPV